MAFVLKIVRSEAARLDMGELTMREAEVFVVVVYVRVLVTTCRACKHRDICHLWLWQYLESSSLTQV